MHLPVMRPVRACALVLSLVLPVPAGAQESLPSAREAWAALEGGDASKAAAIFRQELERSPRDPMLHFGSAYASIALGRADAAVSSLKRAIEYQPKFLQAM